MPSSAADTRIGRWRRDFGVHLRAERHRRELSQEQLAELAGVDRKLIYRTELGQTSPRLDAVVKIADALGVPVGELVSPPKRGRSRREPNDGRPR